MTNLTYKPCSVLSHFSHVQLFATPWTIALQAPLSMGFSRQEYWRGLPCPPPGDLPNPGMEPASLMSPALAGRFSTTSAMWEALTCYLKSSFYSSTSLNTIFSSVKLCMRTFSEEKWYKTLKISDILSPRQTDYQLLLILQYFSASL